MDTRLRALVDDVIEQGQRMKDNWNCWDIQTRHDATNEFHARHEAADTALMDAVRLTDFAADEAAPAPSVTEIDQQPASAS